jgi:hypothetical protein
MILDSYKSIGGVHPETASIKNILAYHGVTAPHTGIPFDEAMILGIGGGLGATYMLWEFEKHGYPSLVIGFRNKLNYPVKFLENLCARLGATTEVLETAGKKKAAANLEAALAAGNPAITWLDLGGAPYYLHFLSVGVVVVYGLDVDEARLDNLATKPYRIPTNLLVEARAKVPSFKNRVMRVHPGGDYDLEQAVRQGLDDCVLYLGAKSDSFALPALRKWARHMTNAKNKKGWPKVHHGGHGLYGSLRTVYEGIMHIGTDGGGLRGLYADFLDEAGDLLGIDDFKTTAEHYRALHTRWHNLAQAALPDQVAAFKTTKELLDQRAEILKTSSSDGLEAITPINDKLYAIKGELNDDFPLNEAETHDLFADIQSHLEGIYQAEMEALGALRESTAGLG